MPTFSPIWRGKVPGSGYIIELQKAIRDFATSIATGFVALGSTPAQSGALRLTNNEAITARNAANTADVNVVRLNASNEIELGQLAAVTLVNHTSAALQPLIYLTPSTNLYRSWISHRYASGGDAANNQVSFHVSGGWGDDAYAVQVMRLSGDGNIWGPANCSMLSFTDRTEWVPAGVDALAVLCEIRGDENGQIDHATLPAFARATVERQAVRAPVAEMAEGKTMMLAEDAPAETETVAERNLGNMISLLTVAVQQLTKRLEAVEKDK
jgi:hypothetical protein